MLKDIQSTGKKDTRSGFGDGIVEAARKNENVVALTADLAGSLHHPRGREDPQVLRDPLCPQPSRVHVPTVRRWPAPRARSVRGCGARTPLVDQVGLPDRALRRNGSPT